MTNHQDQEGRAAMERGQEKLDAREALRLIAEGCWNSARGTDIPVREFAAQVLAELDREPDA